jgi:hypothetical protein
VLLKSQVFLDTTPCEVVNSYQCFRGAYQLYLSSPAAKTVKMETECSSETSITLYKSTWRSKNSTPARGKLLYKRR